MAPSISDLTINVFPNTAVFTGSYLSASGRNEDTFTSSDFSVSGDYLVYVIRDVDIIGTTTITINGHTYTYETYDGKDTLTIYLGNLYAWTCSAPMFYRYIELPDNTIYTKTSVVDTSMTSFYLSDGTEIPITDLYDGMADGEEVVSADSSEISIKFTT